jgi:uncharacterized protein
VADDKPFRLLPALDDLNREFWQGGAEGELRFQRCQSCGHYNHPPRPICRQCRSTDLAYEAVSGKGTVHTFTVNHQPWNPTMPERYVIGVVELDEQVGLRLVTNVDCDVDTVEIDMPVEVFFEEYEDVHLPMFRPVSS